MNTIKILNTFSTKEYDKPIYYNLSLDRLVFADGDYRIFNLFGTNFLHTYKDRAISELNGKNILLIELMSGKKELHKNDKSPLRFLLKRAIENEEKSFDLIFRAENTKSHYDKMKKEYNSYRSKIICGLNEFSPPNCVMSFEQFAQH